MCFGICNEIVNGLRFILTPRDKWHLLGVCGLLCIGAVLEIAGLGLLLPLVAAFTKPELFEQQSILRLFRGIFAWADEKEFQLICCGCIAVVYLLKNIWIFCITRLYAKFTYSKVVAICNRLYTNFVASEYGIYADLGKVELCSLISKVEQMGGMVLLPCMVLLVDVMSILFIMFMLSFTIPGVTLGCALIFGVGSLLIWLPARRKSWKIGEGINAVISKINKICFYSFDDIKSIKVYGLEKFFVDSFSSARKEKGDLDASYYVLGQIPRLFLEVLAVVAALGMLAFMLWRGEAVGTVILSFSLLIAAMSRMLPAISRLNYSLNSIRIGYPVFRDIIAAAQWKREDLGPENVKLEFKGELRMENLSFSYPGSDRKIIDHLDLEVKPCGSLAVVGPTGSGKSTLIDLLLGVRQPTEGRITVDGKDIRNYLGAWRKLIGFVPQFIVLADDSIAANVAQGVPRSMIDRERVREVLRIAQLEKFVDSLPEGMDTVIGDNGIRLSGGQRQRLGIARALFRDPEIIIFDEATSALDIETEQALIDALDGLYGQKTLIMVAHRLSTVEKCDQRIAINPEGKEL